MLTLRSLTRMPLHSDERQKVESSDVVGDRGQSRRVERRNIVTSKCVRVRVVNNI